MDQHTEAVAEYLAKAQQSYEELRREHPSAERSHDHYMRCAAIHAQMLIAERLDSITLMLNAPR